jgi:hypothetical protein
MPATPVPMTVTDFFELFCEPFKISFILRAKCYL